ncbi:MAG: mechanosensitive ion channel [Anaerolineales bacterium]|nr:MAG: mechanosensitive ion channel [Anaerolineales bacterium]
MEINFLGLSSKQWTEAGISLLIVIAAAVLGRILVAILIDRGVKRLTTSTKTSLDDALLKTLRKPTYWLILVISLDIALRRLGFLTARWGTQIDMLLYVLYFCIGFMYVWNFIQNMFTWYGKEIAHRTETDLDKQLMPFFRRVALIILSVVGLIMILGYFEVEIGALITTLGIGSLAIALAAQAALSDTISGFMIMIDRPFRIGDRIEILELDTWGDVVDIGLRSSRIRTRDNRMVIVPNSVLGKSLVVNHSYPDTQYRIQIHIGIAYGTDIEKARQVMVEAVRNAEGVLQEHQVEALFLEFGASALIFRVRWWLDSYVDTRRMFDKVNTALYHALNEAGIEIPHPQMDVHHHFKPGDPAQFARLSGSRS